MLDTVRSSHITTALVQGLIDCIVVVILSILIAELRDSVHDPRRVHVAADVGHGAEAVDEPIELKRHVSVIVLGKYVGDVNLQQRRRRTCR